MSRARRRVLRGRDRAEGTGRVPGPGRPVRGGAGGGGSRWARHCCPPSWGRRWPRPCRRSASLEPDACHARLAGGRIGVARRRARPGKRPSRQPGRRLGLHVRLPAVRRAPPRPRFQRRRAAVRQLDAPHRHGPGSQRVPDGTSHVVGARLRGGARRGGHCAPGGRTLRPRGRRALLAVRRAGGLGRALGGSAGGVGHVRPGPSVGLDVGRHPGHGRHLGRRAARLLHARRADAFPRSRRRQRCAAAAAVAAREGPAR